MADAKITQLTEETIPASTDLAAIVDDPGGTPATKKTTLTNLITKAHGLSDGIVKIASGVMTPATEDTDYQGVLSEGAFADGDKTKLDTIESNADVTDTANVTAAGALMDSEVDADIKTLSLPANTTISAFGATLVDDADASAARTTLGLGDASTKGATGADANAVTGTAGTSGNLAQWNADGDLVDAGFAVTTGTPGKGSILVGDGSSDYDEITAGTNDQIVVYDSAQSNGVKKVDLDSGINFIIDGGGSAITTGIKGDIEIPFDCTIEQVTLLADQSGSIVIDIWKDTYANFPPTDADSITASAVPTISTATKSQDATLTGWTTALTQGDILRFNVDSITSIQRVTLALRVRRNF